MSNSLHVYGLKASGKTVVAAAIVCCRNRQGQRTDAFATLLGACADSLSHGHWPGREQKGQKASYAEEVALEKCRLVFYAGEKWQESTNDQRAADLTPKRKALGLIRPDPTAFVVSPWLIELPNYERERIAAKGVLRLAGLFWTAAKKHKIEVSYWEAIALSLWHLIGYELFKTPANHIEKESNTKDIPAEVSKLITAISTHASRVNKRLLQLSKSVERIYSPRKQKLTGQTIVVPADQQDSLQIIQTQMISDLQRLIGLFAGLLGWNGMIGLIENRKAHPTLVLWTREQIFSRLEMADELNEFKNALGTQFLKKSKFHPANCAELSFDFNIVGLDGTGAIDNDEVSIDKETGKLVCKPETAERLAKLQEIFAARVDLKGTSALIELLEEGI